VHVFSSFVLLIIIIIIIIIIFNINMHIMLTVYMYRKNLGMEDRTILEGVNKITSTRVPWNRTKFRK
jgi:hypothetical protein